MAKLTKKDAAELIRIITQAERAQNYILSDRIAVCTRDRLASTTLHYSRADGASLFEVAKDIGSEFCLLSTAIRNLKQFVETR